MTIDVAYVGTHGYNESHTIDLNEAPLGAGYTPAVIATCIGTPASPSAYLAGISGTLTSPSCKPRTAITAARPYTANGQFPYYAYIEQYTSGFHSNYAGLQTTVNARNYHGLNFLAAYTWSHALDQWTKSSQATTALADPTNPGLLYGNSDFDVRHRATPPSYNIPGIKLASTDAARLAAQRNLDDPVWFPILCYRAVLA